MSDRMATDMLIGGRIPRTLASDLAGAICAEDVSLDYDAPIFHPHTPDDLLGALRDGHLSLARLDCAWGRMDTLEDFLLAHRIPFTRYTEGKYDYSPEVVYFRRGMKQPVSFLTTPDREIVIRESDITPITRILERASAATSPTAMTHLIQTAIHRLRRGAGHTIPPLPYFAFV